MSIVLLCAVCLDRVVEEEEEEKICNFQYTQSTARSRFQSNQSPSNQNVILRSRSLLYRLAIITYAAGTPVLTDL